MAYFLRVVGLAAGLLGLSQFAGAAQTGPLQASCGWYTPVQLQSDPLPGCIHQHVGQYNGSRVLVDQEEQSMVTGSGTNLLWQLKICISSFPYWTGSMCSNDPGDSPPPPDPTCPLGDSEEGYFETLPGQTHAMPTGCVNSCLASFDGHVPAGQVIENGVVTYYGYGKYIATELECDGGDPVTPTSGGLPPASCAPGETQGEINGEFACVKADGTSICADPTCGVVPSGDEDTAPGAPGIIGDDSGVNGGGREPGTIEAAGDGTEGGTGDAGTANAGTTDMSQFCQENPTAAQCKKSGTFGGSCAPQARPNCSGDPVACAAAAAVWKMDCREQQLEASTLVSLADEKFFTVTEAQKEATLNTKGGNDLDIAAVFQGAQQEYVTFSKTCPAAQSFTYKDRTFDIDLSMMCVVGDYIRVLFHLAALVWSVAYLGRIF